MAEESFMLISLKENKAKKLAQVISNETSRKILDFLAGRKEATETEIAKALNVPISTVHYNLQQLHENKLVLVDEFHYSEKGKEVNHYKLANKLIIIAPSRSESFLNKLKAILPVGLIAVAVAGVIHLYSGRFGMVADSAAKTFKGAAAPAMEAVEEAAVGGGEVLREAVTATVAQAPPPAAQNFMGAATEPNIALWFLYGAIFTLFVYVVIALIRRKKG